MTRARAGRFLLGSLHRLGALWLGALWLPVLCFTALWLTLSASLLTAQEAPPPADPRTGGPSAATQPATQAATPGATTSLGADYAEWEMVAARAEATLQTGRATTFALQRTRAELVIWRDIFLAEQGVNAARIATVQSQIAALGPVPAEGAPLEDPRVAERRAELEAQLAELRAPAIMAAEAYARANGMIGEIDSQLRSRQTTQLMTRGISPLAPAAWIEAWNAITNRSMGLWKEVNTSLRSEVRRETLRKNWPSVLFYLALSGVILFRARRWIDMFEVEVVRLVPRANRILRLLFSTSAVLVPYLGLLALTWAFEASGMFGFRATQLINTVPLAGLLALTGHWLADQFMSRSYEAPPPFDFSDNRKAKGRRLIVQAGWVMAAVTLWQAFLATGDIVPHARAALSLPFDLALAFVLFRLGKLFSRTTAAVQEGEPDGTTFRRNTLRFVGRLTMLTATLAPTLAIIGFSAAAAAILVPTVSTLFVLAVVVRLQWLAHDLYSLVLRSEEASRDALIPVLVGILLLLLALPVLAVVWGARVEDLVEIWARFREGVSFGDTRISPSDLVALVVVFGIGYALTRLIQSTLRTTILPRTKLDPGGRMAVVAGVGYVGIFVAAVAAISSAGLDLSNLAIVAGALSVGIGFGLQNIVSNFVSGIILLIERPIGEGDWIEVNGNMGYVRDISVRSTRIETFDRTDVIVPNSDLVSGQVTNWTRGNSVGRVIIPVGVAYGTDTRTVEGILRKVAEAHPMVVLTPPPSVIFIGFGADSLNFEIRAVIRDVNFSMAVRSETNHAIAQAFAENGIEIPFAQRDIWLRNPEALHPGATGDPAAPPPGPPPNPPPNPAPTAAEPAPQAPQRDAFAPEVELDQDAGESDGGGSEGGPQDQGG